MNTGRKNIIVFSFDDSVPFYKYKDVFNEPLVLPNLEKFCQESTIFQSAYCQSPICGPSRASFMSGRTPHQLGVFENKDDVFESISAADMWSCQLKQNGYFCSSGGKVHHYYRPLRRRYHRVIYSDEQKRFRSDMNLPDDVEKDKFGGHRRGFGTPDEKDDAMYYDHQSADSAIKFIEDYDRSEPFYREIGFYSPHGPHYTPARFKEMYNVRNFKKPEEWENGFDETPYSKLNYPPNIADKPEKWWKMSVRNYFSALSHGDYHFGRIMEALKASKHAENTIVILLSDHGFHLGNRDNFKKTTLWEQVAGVPFIIYDPAQTSPREVQDPVALIDVGPTVLDYADLPPLDNCLGRSLRPQVQGQTNPDRVVPTFHHNDVSVRKGDFRLVRYEDGTTEFYDLKDDYWQLRNLGSEHPAYADVYSALVACSKSYGLDIQEPQ
ncbi:sulfatase-like hydrolase/transferase [Parasedimentitalea psychrophila]|uniref:Sulfatase-like hydrolase/transferase n=1 Tax=Parasedimentitalea psychrophila TaxID=2997337 RepID=A0A9Y2L1W9_9RHOB|nr:sulfatase-like hydrolase/transferase [Parasedimentitalea psychrophila]WIY26151.1 sulfatase-like hydrolase/transferase [Parasedimentitalea psychrophila]